MRVEVRPIEPGDASSVIAWNLPEHIETSVLRVELQTGDERPPRGRVRLVSPAATEDRDVELRGHAASASFAITVPASEDLFLVLHLDGYEPRRLRTSTGPPSSWAELDHFLIPERNSGLVDLIPTGEVLQEGVDYHVSLAPVDPEQTELEMHLQNARLLDGRLQLGRLPAGTYRVWVDTHSGWYRMKEELESVADVIIRVTPGVVQSQQIEFREAGTIELDVVDAEGDHVPGAFEVVTETGRVLRPGVRVDERKLRTGGTSSLPGDGTARVVPENLPPGRTTVRVNCPGCAPVTKNVRVKSGMVADGPVELQRTPVGDRATDGTPILVWLQPATPDPAIAVVPWTADDSFASSVLRLSIRTEDRVAHSGLFAISAGTDRGRIFELDGHPRSGCRALRVPSDSPSIMRVQADGYEQRFVRLRTPRTGRWGQLTVDLEPTKDSGTVTLRTRDEPLLEGQELVATVESRDGEAPALVVSERRVLHRDGRIRLGRLPAGRYVVRISSDTGWSGDPVRIGSVEVDVAAGRASEPEFRFEAD